MAAKRERRITLRAQWLGQMLRRLREQNGLTLKDAAEYLQKDFSTVSRFELGTFPVRRGDLLALMDLYGVDDRSQRDTLLQLCGEVWQSGWWEKYSRDGVWGSTIDGVWLESRAHTLRTFAALTVPGLLQTPEYARALIEAVDNDASEEQIERWVELRLARQQILTGEPLEHFSVVLDEAAIRRPVGGATVMAGQLRRLVSAAEDGQAEIRVVPFSVGAHPSPEGAFTLITLGEPFPTVAHIESGGGGIYLERGDADRLAAVYDRLRGISLNSEDSVAFLAAVEKDLS